MCRPDAMTYAKERRSLELFLPRARFFAYLERIDTACLGRSRRF